MKTIKVNVWQMGYTNRKDFEEDNRANAICRSRGYVEVENTKGWKEEVWHLLNWGCWSVDENGESKKPQNVHSLLDHCNADIILNVDGTKEWCFAEPVGFRKASSLPKAIKMMKKRVTNELWIFPDRKED